MSLLRRALTLPLLLAPCLGLARADTAADAYRAMGIKAKDVLNGTVLSAKVLPGRDKQVVAMTTYFTGKTERHDAVGVRLDVFRREGEHLTPVYQRDFGAENGGLVSDGNLEVVDLDLDQVNEIVVSFGSYADPLIEQRLGEVILHGPDGFVTAWSGPLEYDATKAARSVPVERRDRFEREIDVANTLRTRGVTLFFNKRMIAVAGERLAAPKTVVETYPLRPAPRETSWN